MRVRCGLRPRPVTKIIGFHLPDLPAAVRRPPRASSSSARAASGAARSRQRKPSAQPAGQNICTDSRTGDGWDRPAPRTSLATRWIWDGAGTQGPAETSPDFDVRSRVHGRSDPSVRAGAERGGISRLGCNALVCRSQRPDRRNGSDDGGPGTDVPDRDATEARAGRAVAGGRFLVAEEVLLAGGRFTVRHAVGGGFAAACQGSCPDGDLLDLMSGSIWPVR